MREVDPEWSRRLTALQAALALDNAGMAAKFGVPLRTYRSWVWGERNMGSTAEKLLEMMERRSQRKSHIV